MNDQEITVHIDDEPNHDPVAPAALDLRLGGNDLSILTFDDFLSGIRMIQMIMMVKIKFGMFLMMQTLTQI